MPTNTKLKTHNQNSKSHIENIIEKSKLHLNTIKNNIITIFKGARKA